MKAQPRTLKCAAFLLAGSIRFLSGIASTFIKYAILPYHFHTNSIPTVARTYNRCRLRGTSVPGKSPSPLPLPRHVQPCRCLPLRPLATPVIARRRVGLAVAGQPLDGADFSLVPQMETDVTLRSPSRCIVVECKYTESIYQQNYFKGKFRSGHLYQLAAYLQNLETNSEGILLYPTAGVAVDQSYMLHGHRVRMTTLDLDRPWPKIAASLMALVESAN